MAITKLNRKIFDIPKWERLSVFPIAQNTSTSSYFVLSDHIRQLVLHPYGASAWFLYDPELDTLESVSGPSGSWSSSPYPAPASCWSTGSTVGVAFLTATAGTTSTITTNQTITRNIAGWPIHIMSGPNAGQTLTILSNTQGSNSVITVPTQATAFSTATQYRFMTPRWYVMRGPSSNDNVAYDWLTDSRVTLSVTNAPSSPSHGVTTPSWVGSSYLSFATGTATSATSTTLVNSAKSWTVNQWVNYQVRIVSGTGAGQIRTITANTATTLTVATWTITPDSTSVYSIEGNDDFIYFLNSATTNVFRYTISTNTWTTLNNIGVSGTGEGWSWVGPYVSNSTWNNESAIISGRRIYRMFSGGTSIYYYDIPTNGWNAVNYESDNSSISQNGGSISIGTDIYYYDPYWRSVGPAIIKFDAVTNTRQVYNQMPSWFMAGTNSFSKGPSIFPVYYKDGNNYIWYLYVCPKGQPSTTIAGMQNEMIVRLQVF